MSKIYTELIKKDYLPLLTLIAALSILGFLLFSYTSLSQQPPVYDALTYVSKAKNFWDSVSNFRLFNLNTWVSPLNIQPTVRPPGTVVMSYPFGFSEDTHGFFFRSIFLPVILFVAALWIVAKPYCSTLKEKWLLVTLCLALATLPMFYHLEPNADRGSPVYWGLVDNFIAAVAALATALVIRGANQASIRFTQLGITTSAFCLFIKPAGGLVMAAIFFVWALQVFAIYLVQGAWRQNKAVRKYLNFSLASFLCIYGIALLLSLTSHYFSKGNMEFGKRAMEVLQKEFVPSDWWLLLRQQIHTAFGWHWVIFIFFGCTFSLIISIKKSYKNYLQLKAVDLLSATGVMLLGLWFWFFATGQTQIRYFFPFALISLTICFPRITSFWTAVSKHYFKIVIVCLLCPFLLLLLLLSSSNPSVSLQRIMGISLISGSHTSEVQQARALVAESRKEGRTPTVYSLSIDFTSSLFEGVGSYEKILRPNANSFNVKYPIDWVRDSTYRFSEMISSNFLLFQPIENPAQAANIINIIEVPSFASEDQLFRAWLSTINLDSGLEYKSQTSLRLLEVTDKSKFENALNQLKAKHKWRQVFLDANLNKWIDKVTAKALIDKSNKASQNIRFGDKFVLLGIVTKQIQNDLKMEFVWQSLKKQPLNYITFVHVLDSAGNMLTQADYEQDAAKQVVDKGTLWHDVVKIPVSKVKDTKAIGIGIYLPPSTMLAADRGSTDWNKHRLLINLK